MKLCKNCQYYTGEYITNTNCPRLWLIVPERAYTCTKYKFNLKKFLISWFS